MDDMASKEENPPPPGRRDVNLRLVGTVFAFSTILVALLIVLTQALYLWQREVMRQRHHYDVVPRERVELKRQQESRLNEVRLIEEEAGRYSIPIDRAMRLVVEEYGREE